jgi:hypothetical protein
MGQPIAVVAKPSPQPHLLRFEANRNLTGMGHETFTSLDEAIGPRPAAMLARDLLGTGQVDAVHMYGNMITVDLRKGFDGKGLTDVVRDLYQYWKPGMEPPTFDDVAPETPAAGGGGADAAGGEAGGADSEYLRLVPPHLVERSQAALAKWKANH